MKNNSAVLDEPEVAPAITPDMLTMLKKEDMNQAVVERFKVSEAPVAGPAARTKKRSPYWQAADQEC